MKKTRFNAQHRALGAKMIEFCGWDMPVEYTGLIEEHLACRHAAGLFDVSHMGEIHVTGKDALAFVQHISPNDTARLSPGMVLYTGLMTAQGTYVDDMLIYCVHPEFYLLVVNAANTDKDFAYVQSVKGSFNIVLDNASDRYSQIALQGRQAIPILQPLTNVALAPMHSFTFAFGKVAGKECIISRTGYTGEDGFEVYTLDPDPAVIWDAIMEKGKPLGLKPVGLGARDTLRRHRRHHHAARMRLQMDRQVQEGRLPGPRRDRPAERAGHHPQVGRVRARRQGDRPAALSRLRRRPALRPGRLGHLLAAAQEEHRLHLPADRQDRGRDRVRDRHPR